jgi:hypothetical protein
VGGAMNRLEWLPSLRTHLLNDMTLPDSLYVEVKSEKTMNESLQYGKQLWIWPMMSSESPKPMDCGSKVDYFVNIMIVVKNAADTRNGASRAMLGTNKVLADFKGAHFDAADLENKVRASVIKWNQNVSGQSYSGLKLVRLEEPTQHNDFLILPQLYKMDFYF